MGREANCVCEWNGEAVQVKALIEPPELILRGGLRSRIPFAEMKRVTVAGDVLHFSFRGEKVLLRLGKEMAPKWAKALLTAPPSLAKKLGIVAGVRVRIIGKTDDDALEDALSEARRVARGGAEVVVARVNTAAELRAAFVKAGDLLEEGVSLWVVYRKGPGHAIDEADVRSTGLAAGVVDVKVASVSAVLTGLKFVKRKSARK